MTLPGLDRNLAAVLSLAVIAGREDPRWAELGGNAVLLLEAIQDAGGLEELVRLCRERGAYAVASSGGGG